MENATWRQFGGMAIAIVLCGAMGAAALLVPEPNTLLASALRDIVRFLILASLAYVGLRFLVALGVSRARAAFVVLAAALVVGAGVELAEWSVGRALSAKDVIMDLAAGVAGVGAMQAGGRQVSPRSRTIWGGIAMALVVLAVLPFSRTVQAYAERHTHFPVLLDSQRPADTVWVRAMPEPVRIGLIDAGLRRETGETAFEVPLGRHPMPGLALDEPFGDWTGFSTLAIDLINPGDEALELVLNIDDMRGSGLPGDRYDERISLAPHSRRVLRTPLRDIVAAIPHRRFALDDMDIVMIYRDKRAPDATLLVRKIWLE